ncbi:hypothetical protein ACWDUD_21705 [Rhodococcus sp. NPDC003382]
MAGTVVPAAASATPLPPVRALQIETEPAAAGITAVVYAPRTDPFTLTLTSAQFRTWDGVPAECAPGSSVTVQVLNIEDRVPKDTPALTRSVLVCELGVLDIGSVHTVPVPVPQSATDTAAFAAGSVFTASLRSGERLVDRVEHPAPPVTECAPPGRAPTRPAEDRSSDNSAGGARKTVPATASGQIAGHTDPGTRLFLTGTDACEDRIDRTVTATCDGQFRFTGLLPGRYVLLDETGQILRHIDLDADTPVVEDLLVAPVDRLQ